MRLIGVMGPGEGATATDCQLATDLGYAIAQAGWVLLTGGRNCGVMAAASEGAKRAQGLTVGILPTGDRADCAGAIDIAIVTGMGNARNAINVLSSEAIVACGMGTGTATEVALALKVGKPVILLQPDPVSEAFFTALGGDRVIVAQSVAAVMVHLQQLESSSPPHPQPAT